jgi:hypothetical protein
MAILIDAGDFPVAALAEGPSLCDVARSSLIKKRDTRCTRFTRYIGLYVLNFLVIGFVDHIPFL